MKVGLDFSAKIDYIHLRFSSYVPPYVGLAVTDLTSLHG